MDDLEYSEDFMPNIDDEMRDDNSLEPNLDHHIHHSLELKPNEGLPNFKSSLEMNDFDNKLRSRLDIPALEKELDYGLNKSHKRSNDIEPCFISPDEKDIKSSPDWDKNNDMNLYKSPPPLNNLATSLPKYELSTKRVKLEFDEKTIRHESDYNKSISQRDDQLTIEKKKELNRKSASQCRKKRKEYVTQLEKRVDDLENEIHSLKRKLRFYQQNEKLSSLAQKENFLQYLTGRYEEYDRLDHLIEQYEIKDKKSDNTDEISAQLDEVINTIQVRQGSNGIVRHQTVNYLLKKVIEKTVPGHVKYFIASCMNENGYFEKARGRKLAKNINAKNRRGKYDDYAEFNKDPDTHIWKEIIYAIGLNSEEIKMLKKQRSKLMKYRERFSTQLQKFLKIKNEFFKISRDMEKAFDEIGKHVLPIQRARFLKYVDKVKYKKEMSIFELWGVKKNKFKVKMTDIGTNRLATPVLNEASATKTMMKKRDKKQLDNETKSAIETQLGKIKKMFESSNGGAGNIITQNEGMKSADRVPSPKHFEPHLAEVDEKSRTLSEIKKYDTDYLWKNEEYQKYNESDDSGLPESGSDESSDDE